MEDKSQVTKALTDKEILLIVFGALQTLKGVDASLVLMVKKHLFGEEPK